jgi:hypothetical protein
MSHMGQKAKYSLRAHVFRCSSNNGLKSDLAACPFGGHERKSGALFDHLFGASNQRDRNGKPKCFRGLEIDDKSRFCGLPAIYGISALLWRVTVNVFK